MPPRGGGVHLVLQFTSNDPGRDGHAEDVSEDAFRLGPRDGLRHVRAERDRLPLLSV
jgi:hypothetical protein